MIIDASLGRASCSAFPSCSSCTPTPVQPLTPQPVMPPPPQERAAALNVQMNTAQTGIANGAVIPLTGSIRQSGNGLCYDAANHAVVIGAPGIYAFDWQVLVQSADGVADVVIALRSLDGTAVLGLSGAIAVPIDGGTLISGSAVAQLRPGMEYALVNASGVPINIPVAGTAPASFAASLNVTEVG